MSVTISPRTESPRNSRRSLVTSSACSNAKDRCVSAASRRPGSRKATPSAVSSAPTGTASGDPTWLLDLDRLAAGVVAAVGAHAVGLLRLFALRARAVRGRLGLPCRTALRGAGLALLLLGDCHRGFLLESAVQFGSSVVGRSMRSSESTAKRGSIASWPGHSPRLRLPPHVGHRPSQSGR